MAFKKTTVQFIRGLAFSCLAVWVACCPAEELATTTLFKSGTEGYHTFRIPAIIRTPGRLIAFCEGRLNDRSDSGEIDLVMKYSADEGANWSPLSVVAHDPGFTCGNPAPVYDARSGKLVLVWTKNLASAKESRILTGEDPPRTVWVMDSRDEGATWSAPVEISATTRQSDWRWYATGPGHAIQLKSGRLLVPANFSLGPDFSGWHSHVIYSDDGGVTWAIGGIHGGFTNESTVAELPDGRVYQNMRSYTGEKLRRVSYSSDGGLTWSEERSDPALVEPVCQGSVLGDGIRELLIFSNPASTNREKMTVRASSDGGMTWPNAVELYSGPSAYSDLAFLNETTVVCVYERGVQSAYEEIVVTGIPLDRLMPGADR